MSTLVRLTSCVYSVKVSGCVPQVPQVSGSSFIPCVCDRRRVRTVFGTYSGLVLSNLRFGSIVVVLPALFQVLCTANVEVSRTHGLRSASIRLSRGCLMVGKTGGVASEVIPVSRSLSGMYQRCICCQRELPLGVSGGCFFLDLSNHGYNTGRAVFE